MARINIEDALFKDNRFINLIIKLGSRRAALGALTEAWIIAQQTWLPARIGIPTSRWKRECLEDAIVEVGLAEIRDDHIYMAGSNEQFSWLEQRSESGRRGGINSGKSRRENIEEIAKRGEAERSGTNPLPLPLPLSLPLSQIHKNKNLKATAKADRPDIVKFIGSYVKAWQAKYGPNTRPDLGGKTQGQIKYLLRDMPLNRACDLIQVYFQVDDPWFRKKCHDFSTFMENLNKVALALDTGATPGRIIHKGIEELLAEEAHNAGGRI